MEKEETEFNMSISLEEDGEQEQELKASSLLFCRHREREIQAAAD